MLPTRSPALAVEIVALAGRATAHRQAWPKAVRLISCCCCCCRPPWAPWEPAAPPSQGCRALGPTGPHPKGVPPCRGITVSNQAVAQPQRSVLWLQACTASHTWVWQPLQPSDGARRGPLCCSLSCEGRAPQCCTALAGLLHAVLVVWLSQVPQADTSLLHPCRQASLQSDTGPLSPEQCPGHHMSSCSHQHQPSVWGLLVSREAVVAGTPMQASLAWLCRQQAAGCPSLSRMASGSEGRSRLHTQAQPCSPHVQSCTPGGPMCRTQCVPTAAQLPCCTRCGQQVSQAALQQPTLVPPPDDPLHRQPAAAQLLRCRMPGRLPGVSGPGPSSASEWPLH